MKKKLFVNSIIFFIITVGITIFNISLVASASAEKMILELSSTMPPGSTVDLAIDKFKTMVEQRSNNRISVTLYRTGQLYNPKTEVEAVVKGALAIAPLHPAFVGGRSAVLEFIGSLGAQGAWIDRNHYWRFTDLPETRAIAENEVETKLNAKLLGMPSGGSGLICNRKRPIHSVSNYKGLKTRIAGSAQALLYKNLGMVPVGMSAKEVYMALQRGTVDGAATSVGRYYKSKWYEVAPFVTVDNSIPDINTWFVIGLGFWNKLSKADQELLMQATREMVEWTRTYSVQEIEESYKKLQAGLVKDLYFLPKTEVEKINNIARPVMHNLIKERAGKEMGDKIWSLLLQAAEEK
ncbi:MAG: TRAP transporter substrate-binding protein [Planctomycetota bacterium]|jgi:TRAP-type C4-dicarboxylate transport system substrate-binding protein